MNNIKLRLLFCGIASLLATEAKHNASVCTFETYSCGPIPPTLKESYIMKGEYLNLNDGTITWQEEYFDYPNLLAKYKMVSNGMELHFIFDYDNEEVIYYQLIHPGAPAEKDPSAIRTCQAKDLEDSPLRDLYGYLYDKQDTKRRRMFNSNQVFHYGGEYKYAFVQNSTLEERQIPYLEYHGCAYDEDNRATYDKTFLWSRNDVIMASGEDTIPIKINTFGTQTVYPKNDGVPEISSFNYTENIVWFQGNPNFDDDTFRIPRGMYCEDLRSTVKYPNFPAAFSARMEETVIKYDTNGNLKDIGFVWNNETWYDSDENLVRMDYVLGTDDRDVFKVFGKTPVSAIFDVAQGVVYYISKVSGICVPFEIPANSIVISSNFQRKLATPDELLGVKGLDLEYKGKNTARQILCDVWAGKIETDENTTMFMEFYTSTNGWHSESEEDEVFDVPVRITESIFQTINYESYETTREINVFNFKNTKPSFTVFDISNCLSNQDHLFLSFSIEKNYADIINGNNEKKFITSVRQAIADFSKIGSTIHVQNVEIFTSRGKGEMRIDFLLMDQPKLYGKKKQQPGTSLDTAFKNLKVAIDSGSFVILLVVDSTEGAESIKARPNSLIKLLQHSEPVDNAHSGLDLLVDPYDSEERAAEAKTTPKRVREVLGKVHSLKFTQQYSSDNTETKIAEGYYSSGLLAGVGIVMLVVGIVLGIGLMYVYLKKYGGANDGTSLVMHER